MSFSYQYNYPQIAKKAGFKLRQYKDGPLDWHLIGSVEIERLLKDQNVEQIDAVLNHLCEVPLGSLLDCNILDSGIAKYFTLAQFAVQYLMFCRQFMEESTGDLREAHTSAQMEIAKLKSSLNEANNEIIQLHKKITQIEAIREVIYPCHLCSKNFISNDALNLHISRKHNTNNNNWQLQRETIKNEGTERSKDRERENDVNLINTIKLELEIKHLKERLNKTEREIKDKCMHNNLCNAKPAQQPNHAEEQYKEIANKQNYEANSKVVTVQSIGIQSNLMDAKDRDDYSDEATSEVIARQQLEKISIFENKLKDFDEWKEQHKQNNSDFLKDIYEKLQHLIEDYEKNKSEMLSKTTGPVTSASHIEELFNIKFDDITKKNEAKFNEILNKLEISLKTEINEIKELTNKKEEGNGNAKIVANKSEQTSSPVNDANNKIFAIQEHDNPSNYVEPLSGAMIKDKTKANSSSRNNDKTYSIHGRTEGNTEEKRSDRKMKKGNELESSNDMDTLESAMHDDSDESDSYSDNDGDSVSYMSSSEEKERPKPSNNTHLQHQQEKIIKEKEKFQSKKSVQKTLHDRLKDLGIDENTKTISNTAFKRLNNEMEEMRYPLKQKNVKFQTTRSKIKKFVDKLCSTKIPETDIMLEELKPKHAMQQKIETKEADPSKHLNLTTSTPLESTFTVQRNELQERLERILATPIRMPMSSYYGSQYNTRTVIHQSNNDDIKPIPMPRKRVMFDSTGMSSPNQPTDDTSSET